MRVALWVRAAFLNQSVACSSIGHDFLLESGKRTVLFLRCTLSGGLVDQDSLDRGPRTRLGLG